MREYVKLRALLTQTRNRQRGTAIRGSGPISNFLDTPSSPSPSSCPPLVPSLFIATFDASPLLLLFIGADTSEEDSIYWPGEEGEGGDEGGEGFSIHERLCPSRYFPPSVGGGKTHHPAPTRLLNIQLEEEASKEEEEEGGDSKLGRP